MADIFRFRGQEYVAIEMLDSDLEFSTQKNDKHLVATHAEIASANTHGIGALVQNGQTKFTNRDCILLVKVDGYEE